MKPISSGGKYVIFKSIFVSCDNVENDLKNGWNFCLVEKLQEATDITQLLSPYLLYETIWNMS